MIEPGGSSPNVWPIPMRQHNQTVHHAVNKFLGDAVGWQLRDEVYISVGKAVGKSAYWPVDWIVRSAVKWPLPKANGCR